MARAKKDDAVVAYVESHPKIGDRTAEVVAKVLSLSEIDLRVLVHQSTRVRMRAVLLGWHVVEERQDEPRAQ